MQIKLFEKVPIEETEKSIVRRLRFSKDVFEGVRKIVAADTRRRGEKPTIAESYVYLIRLGIDAVANGEILKPVEPFRPTDHGEPITLPRDVVAAILKYAKKESKKKADTPMARMEIASALAALGWEQWNYLPF